MVLPSEPKKIIEDLITAHHFSVTHIAEQIQLSRKTLYKILNNLPVSGSTICALTNFYIKTKHMATMKQS